MQLVLEPPRGGKSWIFFANDLAHDKGFVAYEPCYSRIPDSERWTVNQYLREAAEEFGIKPHIFNQCQWEGSTGWVFWTDDRPKIKAVVEKVAERLGLTVDTSALG